MKSRLSLPLKKVSLVQLEIQIETQGHSIFGSEEEVGLPERPTALVMARAGIQKPHSLSAGSKWARPGVARAGVFAAFFNYVKVI